MHVPLLVMEHMPSAETLLCCCIRPLARTLPVSWKAVAAMLPYTCLEVNQFGAGLLVLGLGVVANIASFCQHGLPGPFAQPYVVELALMALLITVALALKPGVLKAGTHTAHLRSAPRLWTLRVFGFLTLLVTIFMPSAFQNAHVPFQIELAANGAVLVLASWRVVTWALRAGWNDRHRLALASGAVGFRLLVWDPILELAGTAGASSTHGTAVVALAYLIFLVVLARRVARRMSTAPDETHVPRATCERQRQAQVVRGGRVCVRIRPT
jgi:hypothetical protein